MAKKEGEGQPARLSPSAFPVGPSSQESKLDTQSLLNDLNDSR